MTRKKEIQVCLNTSQFIKYSDNNQAIVVVVDILRATTVISTAFENGIKAIVFGYPLNMDGTKGPRCQSVETFVKNSAFHTLRERNINQTFIHSNTLRTSM